MIVSGSSVPTVASVLLVAVTARQRALAPALRAWGEPVRYAVEFADPSDIPTSGYWNVIVIDGESIPTDDAREKLLRAMSEHTFATVLYVANRLPSDVETAQAFGWASDIICQGWQFAERLRRRVQSVALAPWRASTALRMEAERLGDRRLRVVRHTLSAPPQPAPKRRPDRALPFVIAERAWSLGGETPILVAEAFHEGRRAGVTSVKDSIDRICDELLHELRQTKASLTDERAARYEGAGDGVLALRYQIWRIAREELEAIDRHEARPVYEP